MHSVLIVRTRDEDDLNQSLTFESIHSDALPLARNDIPEADNRTWAILVPLSVAVRFVVGVKHREEAVFSPLSERLVVDDTRGACS